MVYFCCFCCFVFGDVVCCLGCWCCGGVVCDGVAASLFLMILLLLMTVLVGMVL